MSYLLDTHILLWWMNGGDQLTKKVFDTIENEGNTIYISAANVWEIAIKASLGKLDLPPRFFNTLGKEPFLELPITSDHAQYVSKLPTIHNDPFDRILISQAKTEALTLITHDKLLKQYHARVLLNS